MLEFEQRRLQLAQARTLLIEGLEPLGFKLSQMPQGAYYLFFDVSSLTDHCAKFASELLEQAQVATTPGHDFGPSYASTHLRIAYVDEPQRLRQAIGRIAQFLARREGGDS